MHNLLSPLLNKSKWRQRPDQSIGWLTTDKIITRISSTCGWCNLWNSKRQFYDILGTKIPRHFRPRDVRVSGLFVPRTIRTLDYSYYEWTIRTLDDSYDGLFVRWTIRTMDFSYHGLFVLWTVRTIHKYNLCRQLLLGSAVDVGAALTTAKQG